MARKRILTKDEVINEAFEIVKASGLSSLNVRLLAKRLLTSTQPIFTLFPSTSEIENEVKKKAYSLYENLGKEALSQKNKPFQALGEAYIGFASSYPHLFALLFMSENDSTVDSFLLDPNRELILDDIKNEYGLDEPFGRRFYFESWIFTHGLAVTLVTKTMTISKKELPLLLHEAIRGIYLSIKEEMEKSK